MPTINGKTQFAAIILPDNKAQDENLLITARLPRATKSSTLWDDPGIFIELAMEASFDAGLTWFPAGGFGAFGGVFVRRTGEEAATSYMEIVYPKNQKGMMFRYSLEPSKAIDIAADIETKFITDAEIAGRTRIGLLSGLARMAAPTYDNAIGIASAANVASLTTAAWTIGGANRYLVGAIASGAGSPVDPSGMKWGGSAGTVINKVGSTLNIGSFGKLSLYTLVAPAAQSATLYGNWGSNQDETAIGGVSANGVDQTTSTGAPNTAVGASQAPSVAIVTVADDFVVDAVWFIDQAGTDATLTTGANQTPRVNADPGAYEALGMSTEVATGVSTTMSWTISNSTSPNWGVIGIGLKPTTGGGPVGRIFKLAGDGGGLAGPMRGLVV